MYRNIGETPTYVHSSHPLVPKILLKLLKKAKVTINKWIDPETSIMCAWVATRRSISFSTVIRVVVVWALEFADISVEKQRLFTDVISGLLGLGLFVVVFGCFFVYCG
jgi:hypothetical protein